MVSRPRLSEASSRMSSWTRVAVWMSSTMAATVATSGEGIDHLWDAVQSHREWAGRTGELARRREFRMREELREIVRVLLAEEFERALRTGTVDSGWQG